jgi:NTE family protein
MLLCTAVPLSSALKCRGLVMSGGGNGGAWEAGVVWGLVNHAKQPEDAQYDVISGVSAGAINAAAMATWEKGQEHAMADWLAKLWENLSTA